MTRRQSVVKRSSEVKPDNDGGCAARARWIDGTTTGVVATSKHDTGEDFTLSVRLSFGKLAGAGEEPCFAHWHVPALLPQQHVPVVPPQQLPCFAAAIAQHERRTCGPGLQCGHFATGAASVEAFAKLVA